MVDACVLGYRAGGLPLWVGNALLLACCLRSVDQRQQLTLEGANGGQRCADIGVLVRPMWRPVLIAWRCASAGVCCQLLVLTSASN